ncbi:DNA-binding XRE family transcriptional regulator [Enterococcus sp. PF1-24]|uniref:helix-turn-helix domain-containing protein n=1 Tax=unclassified Enterococcus TaxID=2608891 RepID=UPI002475F239|nr:MULTISPECIES: helix-turn-helix transcriptional regulator [unclassified Enterococcus]MDH6364708.1 DNA-binding XRE family transcriptional regulator [Enterococcus sp. PFB1-1]MDH6401816.1 DNA-binding XRE family transcriptional regulator [Enterococcus sp. PF1-24]
MMITENQAQALRVKRARLNFTKKEISKIMKISTKTYSRLEVGNWNANRDIYEKMSNWLAEDY